MDAKVDAGEFSEWLDEFMLTMKGAGAGNVPCGECIACCISSKFILVRPGDSDSLRIIPGELLFPAPGLPEGHYLLGYDENGHCPMFRNGQCSIYEFRPETCRQFDCRVFTAAGESGSEESIDIRARIHDWQFSYSTKASKDASQAVLVTMRFLTENAMMFPEGYLPRSKSQLAAMAIRLHAEFNGYSNESAWDNAKMLVKAITSKYGDR